MINWLHTISSDSSNTSGTKNPTEALTVAMNGTTTAMSNANPLLVQQAICRMINSYSSYIAKPLRIM